MRKFVVLFGRKNKKTRVLLLHASTRGDNITKNKYKTHVTTQNQAT